MLSQALADEFLAADVSVIDIDMVPTPVVYYATFEFGTGIGAPLAGEMCGHVFLKERRHGFDDGFYTGELQRVRRKKAAEACCRKILN